MYLVSTKNLVYLYEKERRGTDKTQNRENHFSKYFLFHRLTKYFLYIGTLYYFTIVNATLNCY